MNFINFSLSSKSPQTLINEIENKLKFFSIDQLYNLNFMLSCELSKKGKIQLTNNEIIEFSKFENLINNQRYEEEKQIEINYYSKEEKKNEVFLKNKREREENSNLEIKMNEENKENELIEKNDELKKNLENIENENNNEKKTEIEKDNLINVKIEDIEEKKKEEKEDNSFKLRSINYFNYNKLKIENVIYPYFK